MSERSFKGNKQSLPSKLCQSCGLTMTWRKKWERNWDEVRYCSDRCRSAGPRRAAGTPNAR